MRDSRLGKVKLERALSKRGLASRTQARTLIEAGKVIVNGIKRLDPDFFVNPDTAKFEIEGKKADAFEWRALILHKPKNTVTTRSDEKGRKTVFDLLSPAEQALKLHAVGRLDFATTGLLILTNDTKFSSYLTDPGNEVPRTYVVAVRGEVGGDAVKFAKKGVEDEGEILKANRVEILKVSGRESLLEVELLEGKNREIRRLFLKLGHEVIGLKRVSYGRIELRDLAPGKTRELKISDARSAFPKALFRE